jgi:hypothetical protein
MRHATVVGLLLLLESLGLLAIGWYWFRPDAMMAGGGWPFLKQNH